MHNSIGTDYEYVDKRHIEAKYETVSSLDKAGDHKDIVVNLPVPTELTGAQQGIAADTGGSTAYRTKLDGHINTHHGKVELKIDSHIENPDGCRYEKLNKKTMDATSGECCNYDKQRNETMDATKLMPESESRGYEKLNRATMESSLSCIASEILAIGLGSDWYQKLNKSTMESDCVDRQYDTESWT